jgi:uncharacterized NAD-dependent epimerase/dehydratase family protein
MPRPRRFAILAEGSFGPLSSKTANAAIRFAPHEVAAVIDGTSRAATVEEVLGFGGSIPVVGSFEAALRTEPTALLIGIAPQGGRLPEAWRALVIAALGRGLDVWSGLHTLLGDDPDIVAAAARGGAAIRDLRRAPADLEVAAGRVRSIDGTVVLTVGADCNLGKMTTQLRLLHALRERGVRTAFAATGQTGILLEGRGIAVDAVVSDFIAGAAERLTLEAAADGDVVLVEGQGAITHPAYSGVTLGLLHGALPHAMILCAQPSRTTVIFNPWVPIPPLRELVRLYETLAEPLRPAPVIGVALNTFDLTEHRSA